MSNFKQLCLELENEIRVSYEHGVTLDDAEKLAARFLYAQIQVSVELKKSDLDSRMRKSGVKAVRAAIYTEASTLRDGRKPTEAAISAMVDMNELVQGEQNSFDQAEVDRDDLERYYNIFREAHIYYRGISKGRFE